MPTSHGDPTEEPRAPSRARARTPASVDSGPVEEAPTRSDDDPVPRRTGQHRVAARPHVDELAAQRRTSGSCDVRPGGEGAGDPVAAPVRGQQVTSAQRLDGISRAAPGRECDDAPDERVVGDGHGHAPAHRVADEHDRQVPDLLPHPVQRPAGVRDRGRVQRLVAPAPAPVPASVLDLAADARYFATGKRKRAVARVILKPGTGVYSVNGREMRWRRDDPKISQRMSFTASADGKVIEQVGQMSKNGGAWQDDLTLTYHLVAPDPTDLMVDGS